MTLDEEIKNRAFKRCYLLYGTENFLKNKYIESFTEAIVPGAAKMMNYDYIEEKAAAYSSITDASETMPFMNEYRLLIIKNSGLFTRGRKDETSRVTNYISRIPESSIIIFAEEKVEKSNVLYKAVKKVGECKELIILREHELVGWLTELLKKDGIEIRSAEALYFLRNIGGSMDNMYSELQKLIDYKASGMITNKDIDDICTKSPETKIFNLVEAIGNKDIKTALDIYSNLLLYKESPIAILGMISRQFRLILQCKYLRQKGLGDYEISVAAGIREFTVKQYISQARNFSNRILLKALDECLQCDVNIKTGKITDRLGVELLILKYGAS